MISHNLAEKEKTFSEHMMQELRYGGGRFCYNYLFTFCVFWAVILFLAPFAAMTLEVIEYGHHAFGTGIFDLTLYEWMQGTLDRISGLLLLALMMFTMTVIAIENFWASKFFWMVPTALVHLVLLGAMF